MVLLNRELQQLRIEFRHSESSFSKAQKNLTETKKQLEAKDLALEKVRRERDELSALASQDQFKSIRSVESQRQDTESTYRQLQKQY